jgi:hypothetical protein
MELKEKDETHHFLLKIMLETFDLPKQGDLLNCDRCPYRLYSKGSLI